MSSEMSTSDLLPLVAVALNDRAAADASRELAVAKQERDQLHKVEVIRQNEDDVADLDGDVVVYASAPFESGCYGLNPNLWSVDLQTDEDLVLCPLAKIRECRVCVGGGFPMVSFDENHNYSEGWLEGDSVNDSVEVSICTEPYSTWINFLVHGWPRQEWEAVVQDDNFDAGSMIEFLVETVAVRHPTATVEFKNISFVARHIRGVLNRCLTPQRQAEVRADRDNRSQMG